MFKVSIKRQDTLSLIATICAALISSEAGARLTRIQIDSRQVVAGGMSFGSSGPYEKLRGTAYFEVDPLEQHNTVVFDIDKAPRNVNGNVEFSADMFILKPVDMALGNGVLLYEVNNRGQKNAMKHINDAPSTANMNNPDAPSDFGNGFLLEHGYALAWVGWEGDVVTGNDRLTIQLPVATNNGKPITELIITELSDRSFNGATPFSLPLSGSPQFNSYASVSTHQEFAMAELRVRKSDSNRPSDPEIPAGVVIPRSNWSFANCPNGTLSTPSTTNICLPSRFRNDSVYELVYQALNPPVTGLGYVGTRDFVSFLHNSRADDVGIPNPIAGVRTILGFGGSSSGMYLVDFVYQGFNEDEASQRVFDGLLLKGPGAHKLFLNYRFAQPNPFSRQHADRYIPDTNFPQHYGVESDPITDRTDGILKRATDPKIIHVDSSTEYWQFRSSLKDTDVSGSVDVRQPCTVRRYLLSSVQHATTKGTQPDYGIGNRQCQQLSNATHPGAILRALTVALTQWVRDETLPPPSNVPTVRDGTLVSSHETNFPAIPGINYVRLFNASGERDFGPRVSGNSGIIDALIPVVLSTHTVLVPRTDAFGNDIAGIRHPFVEAPIATLTGWSIRRPEFTDGDLCDLNGMTIPLAKTLVQRMETGDPRPSLEELYGDHSGYVGAISRAAWNLYDQRLFLEGDVYRTIYEADQSDVLR